MTGSLWARFKNTNQEDNKKMIPISGILFSDNGEY
jgi:hypothetical protein